MADTPAKKRPQGATKNQEKQHSKPSGNKGNTKEFPMKTKPDNRKPRYADKRYREPRRPFGLSSGDEETYYRGETYLGVVHGTNEEWSLSMMQELNPFHVSEFSKDSVLKNELKKWTTYQVVAMTARLLPVTGNNAATSSTLKVGYWSDFDSPGGPNNINSTLKMPGRQMAIGQSGMVKIAVPQEKKVIDPTSSASVTWAAGSLCCALIGKTQGVVNAAADKTWTGPLWQVYLQYTYRLQGPTDATNRGSLEVEELPEGTTVTINSVVGEPVTLELVPPTPQWNEKFLRLGAAGRRKGRSGLVGVVANILSGLASALPPPFDTIIGGGIGLVRKVVGVRTATFEIYSDLASVERDEPVVGVITEEYPDIPVTNGSLKQFVDPQMPPTATHREPGGGIVPDSNIFGLEEWSPAEGQWITLTPLNGDGVTMSNTGYKIPNVVTTASSGLLVKLYTPSLETERLWTQYTKVSGMNTRCAEVWGPQGLMVRAKLVDILRKGKNMEVSNLVGIIVTSQGGKYYGKSDEGTRVYFSSSSTGAGGWNDWRGYLVDDKNDLYILWSENNRATTWNTSECWSYSPYFTPVTVADEFDSGSSDYVSPGEENSDDE
uniref:Capsid protein n=1 Tax=Wenling plagiopsetta astrovirus TaxID=2116120 RepID=A0A2P1GMF5_9VIRU|nr:capsid protein [Wenling plagiopsetta astrovirus]